MKPASDAPGNQRADAGNRSGRTGVPRRDFLKWVGAGSAAAACHPWRFAMAGPLSRADFEHLVPADKKLTPEWLQSLTARGQRAVYRGTELAHIGMPVGGVCAGQVYLGGDGRLWHWDIFNRHLGTGAEHYAHPLPAAAPLAQGFALRLATGDRAAERILATGGWQEIAFNGEYPMGRIEYADPECPVKVRLEAYSPFIPLALEDSSLPATVLEFTVENPGPSAVAGELGGWLENAVCLHSAPQHQGVRRNRLVRAAGFTAVESSAEELAPAAASARPDLAVADFADGTYHNWTVTGTAFGSGPVTAAQIPAYQGDLGAKGPHWVNSHASAPGNTVEQKDAATGRMTSRAFTLERDYLTFLIGGGNHPGRTCLNLVVADKVVRTATGADNNRMRPVSWDVRPWAGQAANLVIVDEVTGAWGNIGVDDLRLSDRPRVPVGPLAQEADFGTMALALLDPTEGDRGNPALPSGREAAGCFASSAPPGDVVAKPFGEKLVGALVRRFQVPAGGAVKIVFVLAWHFPALRLNRLPPGRSYGARFASARAVAEFVVQDFARLASHTRLWHDTWYHSSLPYWFLDRTFLNTSILATATCLRFGNGRFYSWEGVGCCEGTCGHVWHYAHAPARLFPELERSLREQVDFGLSMQPDGAIHFRGEFNDIPAVDAQAGAILRALREHQMSADRGFLTRNWPRIKRATQWLMAKDGDGDGLIEGNQHNTLDTDWFGPVAWLSGLYLAALAAAETLAGEAGDREFAARCRGILTAGRQNLVARLYDQDYFVNRVAPQHLDAINSGTGCAIDQVMGQSWAFQVGLPRVLPEKETKAALQSLWRYNFTPDVGAYRKAYPAGRWYAMPGEAGLLMCTFPREDWDYAQAKGKGPDWAAGYFNECMNGFEYQAAGHMIWEGMLTEGLAVTRAVHDRYHPARRNPWNEVECGDHYVRSMAGYGVFLAVCGYEYHGPQGRLAFAPRLTPEDFRAAFTTAAGWGGFAQQRAAGAQRHQLELKYGELRLTTLGVTLAAGQQLRSVAVTVENQTVAATARQTDAVVEIALAAPLVLRAGEALHYDCLVG